MSKKTKYTDEPIRMGERVEDFLPPPSKLVKRAETIKVTLELTADSLKFFKRQAKLNRVPYQRMLRGLIDAYVSRQEARADE